MVVSHLDSRTLVLCTVLFTLYIESNYYYKYILLNY